MSLFSLANLSIAILCISLAVAILPQAKNYAHRIWAIFNIIVALWALGLYFVGISGTPEKGILFWKWTFIPNTFIPVLFYHLIHAYCNLRDKKILIFVYVLGGSFIPTIPINYFVSEPILLFNSIYYFKPTPVFILWSIFFISITTLSFQRLFNFILQLQDAIQKREALYLFWGGIIGFVGGIMTTILPLFKIMVYPVWHFSVSIYAVLVTFAILRHKIFDLRVTLIRSLVPVFIFVVALFIFCFTHFRMNLFALASLTLGVACLLLAYLILAYAQQKMHRIWAIFNLCLAVWGLGTFVVGVTDNYLTAWIAWKVAYVGVLLVSVFFYHMIYIFCGLTNGRMLKFSYGQGIAVVSLVVATNLFIDKLEFLFNAFYYNKATVIYFIVFVLWMIIVVFAFWELFKFMRMSRGIQRTQAQYLFWGMLLGFAGGTTVVVPAFGIRIYPYGHFFICIYAAICTYAIFKYQLMDISIAVTRLGVFVVVYSLVLGIPFGLVVLGKPWLINILGENWFWAPMLTLLVLATSGPFIYLFIQRKAEDVLLQEERRINSLLTQASYGMTTIRDLTKLLNLIVDVLQKILGVEKAQVFILNQAINEYELKAPHEQNSVITVNGETALVEDLMKRRVPLVRDEMRSRAEGNPDGVAVQNILSEMNRISCSVIVPIAIDSVLLGFIGLGDRKGKETYSQELLNVLGVLGNQAALAVKNCYFLEEEAMRMERLGLEERRISLDHLTASMAHEIDNPMGVILGHTERLQEGFQDLRISMPEDLREDLNKSLNYILEARSRVSGMIKAIKEYSRKTTGALKPIKMYEVEEGYWTLFGREFRKEENRQVKYTKEIGDNLPYILGDKIQLEEVLFNLANNSLHAVSRREIKEIKLRIFQKDADWIRIEYWDTGYGIEKSIIKDIFLAHVTTKGSTEGSGLGLYRVRKIIELHGGRIWAESEGKDKGAKIIAELPVFKGNVKEYFEKQAPPKDPKKLF